MHHDEIESILQSRVVPPAGSLLAERIIHNALIRGRNVKATIWQELLAMFALPHPAAALAVTVLFGLASGLQAGAGLEGLQPDWSSFLDINDGGWL